MPKPWVGKANAVVGPLVVFGLSCGVFVFSARVIAVPPAWITFEFCQYAEIGKNLANEGVFDTRLVEPMALAYIDRYRVSPAGPRWPVINRYPLPCLVIAGLMQVMGVGEAAAAASNGLAVSGLAALAYVLARRWYGPGWAALVALLILANPAFYGYFILLGTPDVWFALVFNLELLAWCRVVEGPGRGLGPSVLTGVLAGLAYLARFNVLVFLAPQAAVLLARRRWRETAALGVAAALVVAPLLAYNVHHFGRPMVGIYSAWNLLDDVGAYTVEPWLYYKVPDLSTELRAHLRGVFDKFVTNLTQVVPVRVWSLWHFDLILPLAVAGVVAARPGGVGRRYLTWSAGLFAFQLVLFSGLRLELEDRASPHHGRYFFWFAVPALLLGVGTLRRLSGRSRWWHVLTAVVVAGQLALFGQTWARWVEQNRPGTNIGRDPVRRVLSEIVDEGQVIASNQPQMTDWYSGLKSVSLPADPGELDRLNRDSPTPIDYVFIDLNLNAIDLDPRWGRVVRPGPPGTSPWERELLGSYEYVLPPARTRPVMYVLLRRRGVPPSRLERVWGQVWERDRAGRGGTGPGPGP
jgi:hypothetical protein